MTGSSFYNFLHGIDNDDVRDSGNEENDMGDDDDDGGDVTDRFNF